MCYIQKKARIAGVLLNTEEKCLTKDLPPRGRSDILCWDRHNFLSNFIWCQKAFEFFDLL